MKKLALTVLVCLALPSTALSKGPTKAIIAGPGMPAIRISGAEGNSTPFWHFVEAAGFFEAAWGPAQLPQTPPDGELGPRYTITWTVPSSSRLHQQLYPYAKPYPVTYMPRRQRIYGNAVEGGWFSGGRKLERALLRIGVPARPRVVSSTPSTSPPAPRSPSGSKAPIPALAAMSAAIAVLALAGAARSLRRRSSGAAGT
jgi:hypothetical protein